MVGDELESEQQAEQRKRHVLDEIDQDVKVQPRVRCVPMRGAHGLFTATHSPQVRALAGQTLTLSGFVMPLETTPRFQHFILTRYTPVCPFCPPGAPNEVVEVFSVQPISQTDGIVRVTGEFSLTDDGEMGLFLA